MWLVHFAMSITSEIRPQPYVVAFEQISYGLGHILEVLGVVGVVLTADDAEAVQISQLKEDRPQVKVCRQLTRSPPRCGLG